MVFIRVFFLAAQGLAFLIRLRASLKKHLAPAYAESVRGGPPRVPKVRFENKDSGNYNQSAGNRPYSGVSLKKQSPTI